MSFDDINGYGDEYSLESILAEFGSKPETDEDRRKDEAETEPRSAAMPVQTEDDPYVLTMGGSSDDEPRSEPTVDLDGDAKPKVSDSETFYPQPDPSEEDYAQYKFDDSDFEDVEYASDEDYDEYGDDDDDEEDDEPRPSLKERIGAPLVAFAAYVVMKVQQSKLSFRAAPPEEAEDLGEEMLPDKAAKFYDKHIPWLKLRTKLSFFLSLIMAYISLGFPVSGVLNDVGVKASVLLIMLLSVMLFGADVFVCGAASLIKRRPDANSLVALSCLISVIDAAIIACGVKDYGIPYCAVAALTMSFTLLGSVLNCRSNRIACRSAAALHNPYTLTAETSVSGEGITLLKSRCGTKDFVRRTEEFGPDEAAYGLMAPYLIIISLLLSIIAAATGGSFRGFAHILSGIFVFSAPFVMLIAYPLPFFVSAKHLIKKGAAIAGWSGLFDIGKSKHVIISDTDLFAKSAISIEKVHILSGTSPEKVLSLAGSIISASGSALAPAFMELMRKGNGSLLRIDEFTCHESGGLVALINGEEVLCGSSGFMQLMGIRLPQALALKDCVFLSASGVLCGFFEIRYTPSKPVRDALAEIMRSGRHPIFALRDFNMTPQMLSRKFDIPTDGFDFPSFAERYEISAASPSDASKPAALLSRDGLGPLISLAHHGKNLFGIVRVCVLLSIMCTVLGAVLAFSYFCGGNFTAMGAERVLIYMLVWLLPELIMSFVLYRKQQ